MPEDLTPEQVDEYWTRLNAMKEKFESFAKSYIKTLDSCGRPLTCPLLCISTDAAGAEFGRGNDSRVCAGSSQTPPTRGSRRSWRTYGTT
eukprot:COSAG02_NODE_20226_length_842_cov_1.090175_2_plen_90_part_00